ncbi:MAG: hypothetical protein WD266_08040 [Balneolales bacterium]
MKKTVIMCVCHRISFEELKDYAMEHDLSFGDLISREKCCCGCRMCRPYVEKMMRTGQTAFVPGDDKIHEHS